MKTIGIGSVFALLVFGMPLLPLFAQDTPSTQTTQSHRAAMMQSCEHHKAMEAALTAIEKLVADNKTSRDVSKLQATLTQVASEVGKMQESSKKCAGMMEMMSLGRSHYAVTRDRILTREIPGGLDADPVMVLFAR